MEGTVLYGKLSERQKSVRKLVTGHVESVSQAEGQKGVVIAVQVGVTSESEG
jgi:hypothetical protein